MLDFMLPTVNVGIFPSEKEIAVGLYPRDEAINVNMYAIGDMLPEDFFPNPLLKKK